MVRESGWTHNIIIMMNCKDYSAREFYLGMVKKFSWTKDVLIHHSDNQSYSIKKSLPSALKKYLPSSKKLAASATVVKGN